MTEPSAAAGRDAHGRFVPGCSGNPAGKPLGTLNWSTRLRGVLPDDDADTVMRKVVERALDGSGVDGRFLFAWIEPKPRGRPVEIAVPADASLLDRCEAVFAAMARGDITTAEAVEAARVIETERKVAAAAETPAVDERSRAEILAEEGVRVRQHLLRDDVLRAEVAAALRTELEPTIRAEVIAAMRAEVIAAIRTGLQPEFLVELRAAPADPVAEAGPGLNSTCISRDEPVAPVGPSSPAPSWPGSTRPSRRAAPQAAAQAAVMMAGSAPGSSPGAAMMESGVGEKGERAAAILKSSCISRPPPALSEPDPAALRNPARWQNAARIDRMLRNAGAPGRP
ncbi:MAG: hypothetical protein HY060_26230 [Proteobacteria bacterium]|nr:hypothetical protein [Pseudomonadota bacterium]